MTELAEYERRIAYALERIGRGVETLIERRAAEAQAWAEHEAALRAAAVAAEEAAEVAGGGPEEGAQAAFDDPPQPEVAPGPSPELEAMHAALEAERVANALLTERVRAIREKQETTLSALERRLVQATRALEAVQSEATRLKRANSDLMEVNRQLVDAAGPVAPDLVNRSMQAELEALRAARAWETSELSEIVAGLAPIVAAHAKGESEHG